MINLLERVMGMQPKVVVFVDCDGVLNSDEFAKHCLEEEGYDPFDCDDLDPRAIRNLKRIVDETSASIVLSSSWRWDEKALDAVKGWKTRLPGCRQSQPKREFADTCQ